MAKQVGIRYSRFVYSHFGGNGSKSNNAGLQGSTLSGHCMTMGFGPSQLKIRGLLQKGRNHSLPKACYEQPSS